MGKELEMKLHLEDHAQLAQVLDWELLPVLRIGAPYEFSMETTYFDTADHLFSRQHWTVRRRLENGRSIYCVKTPRDDPAHPLLRGEWETEAASPVEAFAKLCRDGAPSALLDLKADDLVPVCGAKFQRRAMLLQLSRQSRCELACDEGVLLGGGKTLPFYELELELKEGTEEELYGFCNLLLSRFPLRIEPKSKFARARELAGI